MKWMCAFHTIQDCPELTGHSRTLTGGGYPSVRLAYNPGPLNEYKAIRYSDYGGWQAEKNMEQELELNAPTVRLVANANQGREEAKKQAFGQQPDFLLTGSPADRLACCPASEESGANSVKHHLENCGLGNGNGPVVRLAHVDSAQGDGALQGTNGFQVAEHEAPALLVSYYYVEPFLKNKAAYRYRDWVLDSGAFSAHNSGASIDLSRYIDFCLEQLASDPTLTEVFSLDVIPKDFKPVTVQAAAEQSMKNCEEMWRQGVPAIPIFHRGEAEEFLYAMAKEYPKIAIGGVAMLRGDQKYVFCEQVFARVWPKKIHGLGMASEELVYGLPFHSVDATNWELAPCAFGKWMKFGSMSVRGSNQDLRSQVKYYLDLEVKARVKWSKQMEQLSNLPASPAVLGVPKPRPASNASRTVGAVALDAGAASGKHAANAIGKPTEKQEEKKPAPVLAGVLDDRWKKNWWE